MAVCSELEILSALTDSRITEKKFITEDGKIELLVGGNFIEAHEIVEMVNDTFLRLGLSLPAIAKASENKMEVCFTVDVDMANSLFSPNLVKTVSDIPTVTEKL